MGQNENHTLRADNNEKMTPLSEEELVEPISGAVEIIEPDHAEIHAGHHYKYDDVITLANAATQDYLITTPNVDKRAHLGWYEHENGAL